MRCGRDAGMNPEITNLHGNWDTMMFGWHDGSWRTESPGD